MQDSNDRIIELLARARSTPPLRTAPQIESLVRSSSGTVAGSTFSFLSTPVGIATISTCALLATGAAVWMMTSHAPDPAVAPAHEATPATKLSANANAPQPASAVEQRLPVAATSSGSHLREIVQPASSTQDLNANAAVTSPELIPAASPKQDIAASGPVTSVDNPASVVARRADTESSTTIVEEHPSQNTSQVVASTSSATTPVDAQSETTMPTPAGALQSDDEPASQLFLEAGAMFTPLRGGFHNVFSQHTLYEPENFPAATTGGGLHAAIGMQVPVSSWIQMSLGFRYMRYVASYDSYPLDVEFQLQGGGTYPTQLKYTASITLDECAFEPTVRITPFGGPLFIDGGVALGLVVSQSGIYSGQFTSYPNGVFFNAPQTVSQQSSTIGTAGLQWDVRAGIGCDYHLGRSVVMELQLRGQYGLNPLFTDNYPRMFALLPQIGLRYTPR